MKLCPVVNVIGRFFRRGSAVDDMGISAERGAKGENEACLFLQAHVLRVDLKMSDLTQM